MTSKTGALLALLYTLSLLLIFIGTILLGGVAMGLLVLGCILGFTTLILVGVYL